MPGVDVITKTITGPAARAAGEGARYFVPGITERGPTDEAILVRSLAEFEFHFGSRVSYGALHDDLAIYFGEGGQEAAVARVVGATPVVATLTLNDRAGSPLATVRIDAKSAGSWGNALTVAVADGTLTNSVTVTISGVPDGDDEVFRDIGVIAGVVDITDIVDKINAGSRWVKATNLGSATAAPLNRPAVSAAAPLVGGDDNRATVTGATYTTTADARFGPDLGDGAIAVPGQPSSAVGAALLAHARDRNRIAILTTAAGQTPTGAKSAAADLVGDVGSEFAGLFYPWVVMDAGGNQTRTVAPTGFVAAARARAILEAGPWRAGAGLISQARYIIGLERELTRTEGDDLDNNNVSAIRTIARTVRVYGWRSLSRDAANYAILTGRDVLNRLVTLALEAMEAYTFRNVDGRRHLFSEVEGELIGLVKPMADAGGLYARFDEATGELIDPGYRVDTSPAVNTLASIQAGYIKAVLGARVSPTGTIVEITIAKAQLTAAL